MENGAYPKDPSAPVNNCALFGERGAGQTTSLHHHLSLLCCGAVGTVGYGSFNCNPLICFVCLRFAHSLNP